jgi:hypothetical protein
MKKITDKGLVILQPHFNIPFDRIERYKEQFTKDIEKGLLIVPKWFDTIYVPEGVEIRMEETMTNTNRDFEEGEKIHCKSWQDLRTTALCLSSKGYGVAVIGFSDMSDDILTVTEVPEEKE